MRRAVAAITAVLLTSCSLGAPSPEPTLPVSTAAGLPSPEVVEDPEVVPDPQLPTGAAATSAESLTEADLPVPEGWDPVATEGSADEGFYGNGTWVHQVDPVLRGAGTLAVGCDDSPPELAGMVPTAVLEGTLDRDGAPGIVLAMEFADDDTATRYFLEYLRQMSLCDATVIEGVGGSETAWFGRRNLDSTWSEAAAVEGAIATFIILQADIEDSDLEAISGQLTNR